MNGQTTSAEGTFYSEWLGSITAAQLQSALGRFDMGDFVDAAPTGGGLFGQNLFVTSTRGKYVFRGRPLVPGQLEKEGFGVALLQQHGIPVPHPYLLDSSTDIFGWPYVLMPRLPGVGGFDGSLSVGERVWVARAIARNLANMQDLTWAFAGDYDAASNTIQPFGGGYAEWFLDDARRRLASCLELAFVTAEDAAWTERIIEEKKSALTVDPRPCFVMGDHHPANVLVSCDDGEWRVSAVFDLPEFYFGDRERDLVRTVGFYLDVGNHQDTRLASAFGAAYLEARPPRPDFVKRYTLSMLRDRLQVWALGKRRGLDLFFPEGGSFREYAERYVGTWRLFEKYVR